MRPRPWRQGSARTRKAPPPPRWPDEHAEGEDEEPASRYRAGECYQYWGTDSVDDGVQRDQLSRGPHGDRQIFGGAPEQPGKHEAARPDREGPQRKHQRTKVHVPPFCPSAAAIEQRNEPYHGRTTRDSYGTLGAFGAIIASSIPHGEELHMTDEVRGVG